MEGTPEDNAAKVAGEEESESWSPLDTRLPPWRIWAKATMILGFILSFMSATFALRGMLSGLPLQDTVMPNIIGNGMAGVIVVMARLRRPRDCLTVAGVGLLLVLAGFAMTLLAALALVWSGRMGIGYPHPFTIDIVLAVLAIILLGFLVSRYVIPWCVRRGLLAREDWTGSQPKKKPANKEGDEVS